VARDDTNWVEGFFFGETQVDGGEGSTTGNVLGTQNHPGEPSPATFSDVVDTDIDDEAQLTVTSVRTCSESDTLGVEGSVGTPLQGLFGELDLESDGSYTYTLTGPVIFGDHTDTFTYTVSDGSASDPVTQTDTATLTINIFGFDFGPSFAARGEVEEPLNPTGNAQDNVLAGNSADDILTGGAGNDLLTGGLGADTFKWELGDQGSTLAVDTITDFDTVANSDLLDLRDLLDGEHSGASANVTEFLHFEYDSGTDTTTVDVKTDGAGPVDQQIVLQNVDATEGGSISGDAAIVANMITQGKLTVDT